MLEELQRFLVFIRPAFSRRTTYCWFVVVFVGFILRTDNFGVSSIIRALDLSPVSYTCLLHFFHSTAWNVEGIMAIWWQWLVTKDVAHCINDRLVLIGDHTKTPKPIKGMLRFILVETSRGRIILMTSDLKLDPITAIQLYCRRVTIETMFDTLKNTLGAMAYHFWSHYLSRASRKPKKNKDWEQNSTDIAKTKNTLAAIEKFVNVQLLVLGTLQLIAKQFPVEVKAKANCWLRTVSSNTPSEFVTRTALRKTKSVSGHGAFVLMLIRCSRLPIHAALGC